MTSKIDEMAEESATPLKSEYHRTTYKIGYIDGARAVLAEAEDILRGGIPARDINGAMELVTQLRALFTDVQDTP